MQEYPWPFAIFCGVCGDWLSSLWRPASPALGPVEPEIIHHLHDGSSDLGRVLSLQHEPPKLCERPAEQAAAGWDSKSVVLAFLAGIIVGAAGAL